MALSQRLSTTADADAALTNTETTLPAEKRQEPAGVPAEPAPASVPATASPSVKRQPLLFDPEPTQRMVVVRRRKRRRSRKIDKAEQTAGRMRAFLFCIVVGLLIVAASGQRFSQALLGQMKDTLRPLKSVLHAPKLEVVALALAALILLYMMPGVESTVKRWLGFGTPKPKSR